MMKRYFRRGLIQILDFIKAQEFNCLRWQSGDTNRDDKFHSILLAIYCWVFASYMFHSVRLGVLCITLELILNPLHSFAELWPRGRISSLAVLEVGVDGGCIKALCDLMWVGFQCDTVPVVFPCFCFW